MIHSENGATEIKGNLEIAYEDFIAVNISMRQLLKSIGMPKEGINEVMTKAMFESAAREDSGVVKKHEMRVRCEDDVVTWGKNKDGE